MTTTARALGRLFDIAAAVPVADLDGGAQTGIRINLANYQGVSFVIIKDAAATDDLAIDLQEHNASSGGTSQDLDIITDFYVKEETTLDNDEAWTKVTQSAASEIAARADSAEKETIWVVEVAAEQLSEGFNYVSINIPDLGSAGAEWGGAIAILWGPKVQRAPENMPAPLF